MPLTIMILCAALVLSIVDLVIGIVLLCSRSGRHHDHLIPSTPRSYRIR